MKLTVIASALFLLALAAPARAQTTTAPSARMERWTHAAIGASVVAHALDLSWTMYGIGTGRVREANPVLAPLVGNPTAFAVAKMGVAVGLNAVLLKQHKRKPKTVIVIAVVQAVGFGYLGARNARVVRAQQTPK